MATTRALRKRSAVKDIFRPMAGNGSGERPALSNIDVEPSANAPSQHIRTF
jgi:hypothetical protein